MTTDLASMSAAGYRLRLIVAGSSERSRRAIRNLHDFCNRHMPANIDVEIIDIFQQPELAEKYRVVAAPTLVRLLPLPVRQIIGDLSKEEQVLRGLDVVPL